MCGKGISCALLVALAGLAPVCLAQSGPPEPSPDHPKYFAWSGAIPCGLSPARSDFLTHMVRYWIAPTRSAAVSAVDVVNYVKQEVPDEKHDSLVLFSCIP